MFCEKCGNYVNDTDKYCINCGSLLKKIETKEKNIDKQKEDNEVTVYNEPNTFSRISIIISIILFVLSLMVLNIPFLTVLLIGLIAFTSVAIYKYTKRKDKLLFLVVVLNCGAIYTALGLIYYLLVI